MATTELKPFQEEGVGRIYSFRGRALLADDQGLGKTIQALSWIHRIRKRRPVVIVTPASMKYTWQAEAAMHLNLHAEVLEGRRKKRVTTLPGDIVVLNYDILESWLPCLLRNKIQCVILDEIHYCKSITAARTKAVMKLVQAVPSVVGLSGTPMTNRPIELWPVLQIIRPDIFPSRAEYAWRYCKPRYTPWGWKYDGAAKLDELHSILKSELMIRRLKKEVLPELPDKERRIISFRLSSYKEYRQAQFDFLNWLKSISAVRADRAKKSQALTKVGYLLRLVAKLKLEHTERWIKEFYECHPGEKLVALTMNRFVIDRLMAVFPGAVMIDGRVKGRLRAETVRKFQNNSKTPLLIGNWKAAGVGITLTAARHIVALDMPWTPGDLVQGEDRIHRIGQKRNVCVFFLIALQTIEEKLIKILNKKASILDSVLNGDADSEDLDIFGELIEEMNHHGKEI